jgi:hypothetical protein
VKFLGAAGDRLGFNGSEMSVARTFIWRHVTMQNGAQCDLRDASVGLFLDDWDSWPAPGKLLIDGLTYNSLSAAVYDSDNGHHRDASEGINSVDSRLKWLALQPPGFHSQPYYELGKYYLNAGEEASAIKVTRR